MSNAAPHLFCFGLGYSAEVLARRLLDRGWRVTGTTRSPDGAARLAELGIETLLFGPDQPLPRPAAVLAGVTHLLSSVPPDDLGDPVLRAHGEDIARSEALTWLGYLSTTGVYGDTGGDWVDEDSPINPSGERGLRRVTAEQGWLVLQERFGLPVHLFRLAGIYGPGRNQLESLRRGTAKRIVKPGQVFSRIHVEDIARVLEASMARPAPGRAYNVCDDLPADPAEVVAYAAGLLGVAPPAAVPLEEADLSPMARSFYSDSKRVSNRRIKEELQVELAFPDYKTGLAALLSAGRDG